MSRYYSVDKGHGDPWAGTGPNDAPSPQPDTVSAETSAVNPGPSMIMVDRNNSKRPADPLDTSHVTTIGRPGAPVGNSVIDEGALMSSPTTVPATQRASAREADRGQRKSEAIDANPSTTGCTSCDDTNESRLQWLLNGQ